MTVEYKKGNLFDEKVESYVNAVNCLGFMGAGIALQFKNRYPDMFQDYECKCFMNQLRTGKMDVYDRVNQETPRYIINFPTKDNPMFDSKIEYVEDGLKDLKNVIKSFQIKSIAIPALGAGLGGLKWSDVKPLIDEILGDVEDCKIVVFLPL